MVLYGIINIMKWHIKVIFVVEKYIMGKGHVGDTLFKIIYMWAFHWSILDYLLIHSSNCRKSFNIKHTLYFICEVV